MSYSAFSPASTSWPPATTEGQRSSASARLVSIDALRGLVILFMLLDHVRETFFLHLQVSDPMAIAETPADLFVSRLLAHLCAPVFVFLTGLSAFLYASRHADGRAAASSFLWRRGLFLVLLEVTVVNFAWTLQFPPVTIYLQVIWVIGLSMIALAALVWLPGKALVALGVLLVAGHNLLDGLHFPAGHVFHVPWAVLHDRGWIEASDSLRLRTSYPLLPWIGVIALGYAVGPWFLASADAQRRQRRLLVWGLSLLAGFLVLRALDIYGDRPWLQGETTSASAMGFFNVTKYPPSLLFLALTLGVGALLLRMLERLRTARWPLTLAVFGAVPMLFYVLHLYVLRLLYISAEAIWGPNQGKYFGFDAMWMIWICTAVLAVALYPVVRAFARFKARRRDIAWLKYL